MRESATMPGTRVEPPWDLDAWRDCARRALVAGIPPDAVSWDAGQQAGLIAAPDLADAMPVRTVPGVPREFLLLAGAVLCHRDAQRHALLYRMLWRIAMGERQLLERATDPDVHRASVLEKAVRRDSHKMKAFVRFREVLGQDNAFVAWFEPGHFIVDRVAPFFARRFTGMRWSIRTPYRSAHRDGALLAYGPGGTRADAPPDDAQEALWQTYYANIFNPARLNPEMMRQEMPQKYWKNLPEARLLPGLVSAAGARVRDMAARVPEPPRRRIPAARPATLPLQRMIDGPDSLEAIHAEAKGCRRCPLWAPATQTVVGEGPADARVMVVGEQPGDEEDLSGRPFAGPAGKLFDRALAELGLDRCTFYITNAVKHFRFEQRGKVRLHRNPEASHARACSEWLQRELDVLQPQVVLCLGATAARAVLGSGFRLMQQRGTWVELGNGRRAMATVHPSWVLRQGDAAAREQAYRGLVDDLARLLPPAAPAGINPPARPSRTLPGP